MIQLSLNEILTLMYPQRRGIKELSLLANRLTGVGGIIFDRPDAEKIMALGLKIVELKPKPAYVEHLRDILEVTEGWQTIEAVRQAVVPFEKSELDVIEREFRGMMRKPFEVDFSQLHVGKWRKLDPATFLPEGQDIPLGERSVLDEKTGMVREKRKYTRREVPAEETPKEVIEKINLLELALIVLRNYNTEEGSSLAGRLHGFPQKHYGAGKQATILGVARGIAMRDIPLAEVISKTIDATAAKVIKRWAEENAAELGNEFQINCTSFYKKSSVQISKEMPQGGISAYLS